MRVAERGKGELLRHTAVILATDTPDDVIVSLTFPEGSYWRATAAEVTILPGLAG